MLKNIKVLKFYGLKVEKKVCNFMDLIKNPNCYIATADNKAHIAI